MRVLLVEDEVKLTQALQHIAKREKINMDVSFDGAEGLYMSETILYDVIILDIMLPKMNGLEIIKHIREKKISTPILMLTAKNSIEDKVHGLDLGADDYLPKPFATQELFAGIRALSRRIPSAFHGQKLTVGNMVFWGDTKKLMIKEQQISLTRKESDIMEMFMKRPNQVFSREQILDKVWGYESEVTENNIEICIYFLRKKMGKNSGAAIRTIRGIGYLLEEE